MLEPYKGKNAKIYAMLAYGSREHAEAVSTFGRSIFGEKFVPVTNFMKLDEERCRKEFDKIFKKKELDVENNMRLTQSAFSPAVLKIHRLEIFG